MHRTVPKSLAVAALLVCSGLLAAEGVPPPVHHSSTFNGENIEYDAALDSFPASQPGHAAGATLTTISYVRTGPHASGRPVLFAFNGGPGGSSIFLNIGVLGPERLELPDDVRATPLASYPLVHNDNSVLDVADVVLIDPVGTGFSRLLDEEQRPYFYSVSGDAAAVAEVIEAWTERHHRQGARIFMLGESYGAVRCVEVAKALLSDSTAARSLAGIALISPSLAIVDTSQRPSNSAGQAMGMMALAAAAWFHELAGRGESLEVFAQRADEFARTEWLPALLAGASLPAKQRRRVAQRLGSFTGISAHYLLEHNLLLTKADYRQLALADRSSVLGEDDSRYSAPAAQRRDPSSWLQERLMGAASLLLRNELETGAANEYRTRIQIRDWIYIQQPFDIYNRDDYQQIDYLGRLAQMASANPELSIFVGGGWFDTTASVGAQQYQVNRLGLYTKRLTAHSYFGGHMFYTNSRGRGQFAADLRQFIRARR